MVGVNRYEDFLGKWSVIGIGEQQVCKLVTGWSTLQDTRIGKASFRCSPLVVKVFQCKLIDKVEW